MKKSEFMQSISNPRARFYGLVKFSNVLLWVELTRDSVMEAAEIVMDHGENILAVLEDGDLWIGDDEEAM